MLQKIKDFTITSKEKAVAAFVVGTVSSYMSQNGLTYKDLLTWSALWALACGVVSHAVVYWVSNTSLES
jgi:putative flippase GtrA